MTTLTWLHLSDLQCNPRTDWDTERVLDELRRDIARLRDEQGLRPDLLLFTGDAAFGQLPGAPVAEQFDAARLFFEEIRDLCDLSRDRVFLVPGNHDVDRGMILASQTDWLARRSLEEIHELIEGGQEWRLVMERLRAYRDFLESAGYTHLLADPERLIYARRVDIGGIDVGIAGLNSAWSCHRDAEKGKLWLAGAWQLGVVEREIRGADLKIGLVHHPPHWFREEESPSVDRRFARLFDILLHGHEPGAWVTTDTDTAAGSVRIAATLRRPASYNMVRLDFAARRAEVWLRRYEEEGGGWVPHALAGKTDPAGVWRIDSLRCWKPEVSVEKARQLLASGRYEEALDILRGLEEVGADTDDAALLRAGVLDELGHVEEADAIRRRRIDEGSRNPVFYTDLSRRLLDESRVEEALDVLRKAAEAGAEDTSVRSRLVEVLDRLEAEAYLVRPPPGEPAATPRITHIEVLRFSCLRSASIDLRPFQVLIGPNASGKTSFLETLGFLGRIVSRGPEKAVTELTQNFEDLVWGRSENSFQLAVELEIPEGLRTAAFNTIRYEVSLRLHPRSGEISLEAETVALKRSAATPRSRVDVPEPESVLTPTGAPHTRSVVRKHPGGDDYFYAETRPDDRTVYSLGPRLSALGNLPEDPAKFPAAAWLKGVLRAGIRPLTLNSLRLRRASPPGKSRLRLSSDGSNLPWLVAELEEHHPQRLAKWIAHLRTALPKLEHIRSIERPDDRHRYLVLRYEGGLEVPSWRASDGTLRLLALTLLAYLPDFSGIYLIEEPENGIHPQAVETLFQSLSSIYEAQILLATHSPVVLSLVEPEDLLCFAVTGEGAADIVRGSEHPMLEDWRREPDLGTVFAAGILG